MSNLVLRNVITGDFVEGFERDGRLYELVAYTPDEYFEEELTPQCYQVLNCEVGETDDSIAKENRYARSLGFKDIFDMIESEERDQEHFDEIDRAEEEYNQSVYLKQIGFDSKEELAEAIVF